MRMLPQVTFRGGAAALREGRGAGHFSMCSLGSPGAHPQIWAALASVSREAQPEGLVLQEGQGNVGSSSRMEGDPLVSFIQDLLLLSATAQKLTNKWSSLHQVLIKTQYPAGNTDVPRLLQGRTSTARDISPGAAGPCRNQVYY